ncbi:hypothetical protein LVJ94_15380 [Pendulispora rubella]|uniref:Uncharacterized protein n=1 Tax=Pendulispora rubella TaxID=2741070 RepID=A0ABZ2LCI1_9BACT
MARQSFSALVGLGALLLTPLAGLGCTVDGWYDETEIQFEETTNIGYSCSQGPGFSWTVRARETGEQATAGCQQPIRFEDMRGGRTYTFDITGYLGQDVCWRGACTVRARSSERTYADCSAQIQSYCAL